MKYVCALFLMFAFNTFCKGQNQPNVPKQQPNSETKDSITSRVPNSGVLDIKQDRKGNTWLATNDGVYRYDGRSFSNITGKVSTARFISVLEDRKGNFWFASLGSGIFYYDGKSFRNFTTRDGLASNILSCIYEDRAGNIWFGTRGGVSRYDGKSFRNFTTNDGLTNNDVHTIVEDKTGKLWFGTRGDMCTYDGKTFTTLNNKDGKAFENVWCMIKDRKGNIWFGTGGLWRYNGSTFTKINQTGAGVIVEDKKGNILASSGGSIFRYDEHSLSDKKPHVTEIKTKNEEPINLPFGILGANDGSIWFASVGGVSRYDGKTITEF